MKTSFSFITFLLFSSFLLSSCQNQTTFSPPPENTKSIANTGVSNSSGSTQMSGSTNTTLQRRNIPKTSSGTTLIISSEKQAKMTELQDKQTLLLVAMSGAFNNPEYKNLMKSVVDIRSAKAIWTPEMYAMDTKIQELQKTVGTGAMLPTNKNFQELINQRMLFIKTLYASKEYKDYMQKNQSKLNDLNMEMKKFMTPEILQLQQEIGKLSKEINEK